MGWRECVLMGFTIWLTFTTGGGWSNVFVVRMDKELNGRGQLYEICPDESGLKCPARDAFYADVFTVINGVGSATVLFFGLILDPRKPFCGPKVCAIIGLSMTAIGFWLLARVDSDAQTVSQVKLQIMLGAIFVYSGPTGPLITAMPMVSYFKAPPSILIGILLIGQYASGMSSLVGLFLLEKAGVPFEYQMKTFCMTFVVVALFNLVVAWLIYPTRSIRKGDRVTRLVDLALWRSDPSDVDGTSDLDKALLGKKGDDDEEKEANSSVPRPLHGKSLGQQICNRQFIFLLAFNAFTQITSTFNAGNADYVILTRGGSWVETFWMVQSNLTPAVLLPLAGLILSKWNYTGGLWVMIVATAGTFIPLLFKGVGMVVISTCFFALNMAVPNIFFYTYIGTEFGWTHFGRLSGLNVLLAGGITQIDVALNAWAKHHGHRGPMILLTAAAGLFLPFVLTKAGHEFMVPPRRTDSLESRYNEESLEEPHTTKDRSASKVAV